MAKLDTSIVDKAVVFAARKHSGDTRKGTKVPYIVHPMEAAAIVAGITVDQEMIAAALLHDTLEDTDAKPAEIEELFGKRVLALVAEESEDKRENEAPESTWTIRKQETLDRLENRADHETNILVLGDKLSNIRAMQRDLEAKGDELWERFNQKDPAMHGWYYREVARILGKDELLRDTQAYKEYAEIVNAVFGID